jgi:hypothetical protein
LYRAEVNQERFQAIRSDVNKIEWKNKNLHIHDMLLEEKVQKGNTWTPVSNRYVDIGKVNLLINTSCEHMDNTWFENIPNGTLVVLQTNDYFSNPQHVNCCKDLQAAMEKYPMNTFLYAGELDTYLYNRFMLIGIK